MDNPNNLIPDDDLSYLWQMGSTEALPIIVEKFGVTEAEAFKIWYDHVPKGPTVDDVISDEDESKLYDVYRNDSESFRFVFPSNDSEEDFDEG